MNSLFTPFKLKGLELKNRVVMPPMCTAHPAHLRRRVH